MENDPSPSSQQQDIALICEDYPAKISWAKKIAKAAGFTDTRVAKTVIEAREALQSILDAGGTERILLLLDYTLQRGGTGLDVLILLETEFSELRDRIFAVITISTMHTDCETMKNAAIRQGLQSQSFPYTAWSGNPERAGKAVTREFGEG